MLRCLSNGFSCCGIEAEGPDRVLAQHYGFTDEELDFINNYDIKYRIGRGKGRDE